MKDLGHEARPFYIFHPALLALVMAATLLRLALSLYFPRVLKMDESAYLLLGHNLLAGNGYTYTGFPELHFPPLHPLFLGLLSFVTTDLEMAGNLENAIFGGLLLLPVFSIALRIYGLQTAWLTIILLVLFPPLTAGVLYWGSMSEAPFLFLLFLAFALFLTALDSERRWMFPVAGGVLGLAYLTREEAIAFFGALLIFALFWLWTDGKHLSRRVWHALGLFALSFLLVVAPYLWYLHFHTGQWMISGKLRISWNAGSTDKGKNGGRIYEGLDSSGVEINWLSKERFQGNLLSDVIAHPSDLVNRVFRHAGSLKENLFSRTNFWWGLLPLVILGLFKQSWSRQRLRYEAFLLTIIAVLLVAFLPFGFVVRYFAPAFPILLMWTARGALELGRWLQETVIVAGGVSFSNRYVQAGLGWFPAGIAVVALCLTIPVAAERAISGTPFGDKEAGRWLKTHIPDDGKVMAQDVAVAIYSGRGWVPSPNTDWIRFKEYAMTHGARYLVVSDYLLEEYRPELASVVRNGAPELELIFTFEDTHLPQKITTFIYRLVKPHE